MIEEETMQINGEWFSSGPARYACDVLEEMRKCHETHNYAPMMGLVEELQSMFSRMESALGEQKDLRKMHEMRKELLKELKKLEKKRDKLKSKEKTNA